MPSPVCPAILGLVLVLLSSVFFLANCCNSLLPLAFSLLPLLLSELSFPVPSASAFSLLMAAFLANCFKDDTDLSDVPPSFSSLIDLIKEDNSSELVPFLEESDLDEPDSDSKSFNKSVPFFFVVFFLFFLVFLVVSESELLSLPKPSELWSFELSAWLF